MCPLSQHVGYCCWAVCLKTDTFVLFKEIFKCLFAYRVGKWDLWLVETHMQTHCNARCELTYLKLSSCDWIIQHTWNDTCMNILTEGSESHSASLTEVLFGCIALWWVMGRSKWGKIMKNIYVRSNTWYIVSCLLLDRSIIIQMCLFLMTEAWQKPFFLIWSSISRSNSAACVCKPFCLLGGRGNKVFIQHWHVIIY